MNYTTWNNRLSIDDIYIISFYFNGSNQWLLFFFLQIIPSPLTIIIV